MENAVQNFSHLSQKKWLLAKVDANRCTLSVLFMEIVLSPTEAPHPGARQRGAAFTITLTFDVWFGACDGSRVGPALPALELARAAEADCVLYP